jgi:hypothetical protein
LQDLLRDATAGDPIKGIKWTRKALRTLAKQLKGKRYRVSHETVRRLLKQVGYRQRSNRKRLSRKQDPARDRQMRYLARQRRVFLKAQNPVISVDTKKKELVGLFKNAGRTWRREALEVLTTDFASDALGKAIPYGIYDVAHNHGFVVVGISHETAQFAVAAIRRWWLNFGRHAFPQTDQLLIQADSGGANGYRCWLWKLALQTLADEFGLSITITHYPTSASKWNLIEHRLFNHISSNWAGQPLVSYETVLKFIRTTQTENGLRCLAFMDITDYPTGLTVTPEQKASLNLVRHRVLPKWNYTIKPRTRPSGK